MLGRSSSAEHRRLAVTHSHASARADGVSRAKPARTQRPASARPRPIKAPVPRPLPVTRQSEQVNPRRVLLLLMVIVIASGGLVSRLVFWQILQHTRLAAATIAQHNALLIQPALRGRIFSADGTPLATDVTKDLVYAVPRDITNPVRTARALSPVLQQSVQRLEDLLSGDTKYAQIAPSVTTAQIKAIQHLGLPGVFLAPVIARDYPEGPTAAQVVGYYGANDQGNYGVEQYYDHLLSGQAGIRSVVRDTAGNEVQVSSQAPTPSHDGADLYLALDGFVQNAAESELHKAVKLHSADGGTIIVMDPHTGYILGMASTPTYDPNHYTRWAGDESRFLNPAISWTYEPGSTFKIITMAAGLDTHVITPDTAFDDTGTWVVGDTTIHNWNNLGNGWETMTQVLQHSANVGASFVSSRLGAQRFYQYVKRFHIGQPTGVDLAGEEKGLLPLPGDKDWTIVNQYTNSYGQGLATTPLQMIRAVAAVANGGVMMKPQIVQKIVYQGKIVTRRPVAVGRVISAQTARTLTGMLVKSAIAGEAQLALIKGYNIAAKTGTANIASGGVYVSNATIASTVAYAPADHPRFVALVILDHPRDQPWGSMTAAPTIHDLFQDLFMHYHIPPSPSALYR
jgi:cell division protein FtsI/penicillin-binding protein 2